MPLMRLFCFRLTVRLGSIIVGGCCILETLVTMIVLAALGGAAFLKTEALYYEQNMQLFNPHFAFVWLIKMCKTSSESTYIVLMVCMTLYLPCCLAMMAGSYLMKRYLLVPFVVLELFRLLCLTLMHVVAMLVVKRSVNVGYLIALTILGTFILLLLFYLWACVVALLQILKIVRSPEYIAIFGDNPLAPVDPPVAPTRHSPNGPSNEQAYGLDAALNYQEQTKERKRLPPAALSLAPFTGSNMLWDDFRAIHSRYNREI
ncbi:uncharacterized protein LOC131207853 [Anopheles bellator]|uniref:uncharacterized protein LOC131207853 n=1 Tax=Anopheles bellator TaxID=139047 RepID=UPI002648B1B6|nr:uncharacterized protein LOC131207853 [Anopheles bellator]